MTGGGGGGAAGGAFTTVGSATGILAIAGLGACAIIGACTGLARRGVGFGNTLGVLIGVGIGGVLTGTEVMGLGGVIGLEMLDVLIGVCSNTAIRIFSGSAFLRTVLNAPHATIKRSAWSVSETIRGLDDFTRIDKD